MVLDLILGTVDVIIDLINDFSFLFGGRKVTSFQFPLEKLVKIDLITYDELRNALGSIPPTCSHFQSMPSILLWTARLVLHEYVCPVVRFTYPSAALYTLSEGTLDWTYYGSAVPILRSPDSNCDARSSVTEAEQVCAVLGIGYVLLEFCLPILFLDLVVNNFGPPLLKFLSVGVYFVEVLSTDVYEISTLLLTVLL